MKSAEKNKATKEYGESIGWRYSNQRVSSCPLVKSLANVKKLFFNFLMRNSYQVATIITLRTMRSNIE